MARDGMSEDQSFGTSGTGAAGSGATRGRLLHLLRTRGRMNAAMLAAELGLTEMAIRRHMHEMERQGSVSIVPLRQPKGRPLHVFELTEAADRHFPKNYHNLTIDLLAELEDDPDTSPLIDRMFEGRKRKLQERYAPRMAGKTLEERVRELTDIQNGSGYMAEMEREDDDGFMLHEYNCPITDVAGKYGQACDCELSLFRSLLEVQVNRTECLAKGGSRCSYVIGGRERREPTA
ncbi:HTH domain-containing protein [Paenibacillus sp. LHD-117]|uniref:helix-turn-helix transcriptional regulator n=1 Tax=Paenibacillus sp. LHD-117 TaxID=3071412 RepID=UPI0027E02DC9|nr:HTH domain-containing protein [Paenibacillus sp. LHD-117]MDQ6421824.1 HTH domain-containing protein [Paenibacillus sp. LHD-117]